MNIRSLSYSIPGVSGTSRIRDLLEDLINKRYVFSIIPETITELNNGIKYYYVVAICNDTKVIINEYGKQAEELFKEVRKECFLRNNIS